MLKLALPGVSPLLSCAEVADEVADAAADAELAEATIAEASATEIVLVETVTPEEAVAVALSEEPDEEPEFELDPSENEPEIAAELSCSGLLSKKTIVGPATMFPMN